MMHMTRTIQVKLVCLLTCIVTALRVSMFLLRLKTILSLSLLLCVVPVDTISNMFGQSYLAGAQPPAKAPKNQATTVAKAGDASRPQRKRAAAEGGQASAAAAPAAAAGHEQATIVMAQLVSTLAREQAMMKSAMMSVAVFASEKVKILEAAKAASSQYHAEGKDMTAAQRAEREPPHVPVWNAIVYQLGLMAKEAKFAPLQQAAEAHVEEIGNRAKSLCSDAGVDPKVEANVRVQAFKLIAKEVKIARVTQCYHASQNRLEILAMPGTTSMEVAKAAIAFLCLHADGKEKNSAAPKGKLERQLQEFINANRLETEE